VNRRLLPYLLAAVNAALAIAAWTRQPWANGPAEWRWKYFDAAALQAGAAPAIVMLAALAGLGILWGHRRLAAWRGALPLAMACGAAFTFALAAAQPGGFARVADALVSRNSFGYVWDTALAPPTRALLADYPAASTGLNQHSLTHPPGPLLAVRALGWLDRLLPAPAGAGGAGGGLRASGRLGLPALAAAAIAREVRLARAHERPVPQPPPGPWAVTALAVLLPALSALAAWPLYHLALRWGCPRRVALLAAVLWLLAPARSLFTPSFDQALPAVLVGAAWLAAEGGRWRMAAAGALLFAACFLSYGCLPALPLVVACAAVAPPLRDGPEGVEAGTPASGAPDSASPRGAGARWSWRRWLPLGLGFALPYLALAAAAGHDPWHALRAALALHHEIAVAPRSYATWLLWNPYDFALLLSPAALGLAAAALLPWESPPRAPWRPAAWTWWALLTLLLLSGGVRGEVGRIWLIWMPFACLFAAAAAAAAASGRRLAGISLTPEPAGHRSASRSPEEAGGPAGGGEAGVALVLATEAALTLALAASMAFVS
jgi:hypothetical protein